MILIFSGNLFQQQGRYEESLQAYNLAILHRPQLAGEIQRKCASKFVYSWTQVSPFLLAAYSQKAKVLYKLKRWAEAERTLLACTQLTGHLQKDPNAHQSAKVSATILMADLLSQNVRPSDCTSIQRNTNKILNCDPIKASRVNEAEDWLLRARKLAPRNPLVYFQLGNTCTMNEIDCNSITHRHVIWQANSYLPGRDTTKPQRCTSRSFESNLTALRGPWLPLTLCTTPVGMLKPRFTSVEPSLSFPWLAER